MIAFLKWSILDISPAQVLVLTQSGLGYEAFINEVTSLSLASETETELHIYHHISEATQSLYGFQTIEEKKVFTELIKISWVGWKVALLILSLGIEKLAQAVLLDDKKTIESIKWIWKKMAEKIVLELKDKDFILSAGTSTQTSGSKEQSSHLHVLTQTQIVETLTSMGYNREAVFREIDQLPDEFSELWDIIPYLVKKL